MQSQYPVVEAVLIGTSPICNSSVAGYYPGAFRSARQERSAESRGLREGHSKRVRAVPAGMGRQLCRAVLARRCPPATKILPPRADRIGGPNTGEFPHAPRKSAWLWGTDGRKSSHRAYRQPRIFLRPAASVRPLILADILSRRNTPGASTRSRPHLSGRESA